MSETPRKKPSLVLVERVLAAVGHDGGALLLAALDVGGHLVAVLRGDERAHQRLGPGAVLDDDLGQALPDGLDERIVDIAHGDDRGDGHAALTGAAVAGRDGRVGGQADVRVGQHEHVVLGSAEGLDALAGRVPFS